MSKTYLKADREKFVKEMTAFFEKIAVRTKPSLIEDKLPYYYLDTPFGEFEVRRFSSGDDILSVFGAFEDGPAQYKAARDGGYHCNQYTGKWNFHMTVSPVDHIIAHIKVQFAGLIRDDELLKTEIGHLAAIVEKIKNEKNVNLR